MTKRKVVLVYQGGIANVFEVDSFNMAPYGRNARRLLQHAYQPCQWYTQGLAESGAVIVRTAACNMAGDITDAVWTEDLDSQPFSDKLVEVRIG